MNLKNNIILKFEPPFSFQECVKHLGRSDLECLYEITSEAIIRPVKLRNRAYICEFRLLDSTQLQLTILNLMSPITAQEWLELEKWGRDWLDLNTSINFFYEDCEKDKLLKPLIEKHYGLRLIGIPDLFEALSWAIIGQQINLNFAYILKKQLVEVYGDCFIFEDKKYYCFPSPDKVTACTIEDLQRLQFSRQKAEYIIGVANLMASGELYKLELIDLELEDLIEHLVKIRGIGQWSAHYVAMKTFRHPNAFPIQDVGLLNAVKKQLKLPTKPSREEMLRYAKSWNGWEAYATFYLWQSLL